MRNKMILTSLELREKVMIVFMFMAERKPANFTKGNCGPLPCLSSLSRGQPDGYGQ